MENGDANPHQLAVAALASRAGGAGDPGSRRGSAAPRRELRCPRLVPPSAVSPAPAPRVHPLAHVHRLRRRSGRAAARGRGAVRALAARSHARMNPVQKSVALKRRGEALGFDAVGVASLERSAHADALGRWLAAGYAGTMSYLHRQAEQRKLPHRIMPEATVAVVTLTGYFHGAADPRPAARDHGKVAQYAWAADYHGVVGRRLERLASAVRELVPDSRTRCYVDAGPVPERELAQRAGLGWIGKNTMLIHPQLGSFTFIGVILTDAALAPDAPFQADRCGTCTRCLEACPTAAFPDSRVLDSRRCISYLTIEHRGGFTGTEQGMVGDWLVGGDVCQDVCPWNGRFPTPTTHPALAPRPGLPAPYPDMPLRIAPEEFSPRFPDTGFERAGSH